MLPSNKSQEIASAFQCFVKTGDKTNIANIKYAELESAILQYSSARKESYYKAMESKLQELKDLKTESKIV